MKRHILHVDDDTFESLSFLDYLLDLEIDDVDAVQTPEQAILRLLDYKYKLIILDLLLPRPHYDALPKTLTERYKSTPSKSYEGERLFRFLRITAPIDFPWETDIRKVPILFFCEPYSLDISDVPSDGLVDIINKTSFSRGSFKKQVRKLLE